jgi:hypothetical protein
MPKTYFRNAAKQGDLQSKEEIAALSRVEPTMSLNDIVAKLAEHGIKLWHMQAAGAQVMVLLGGDAVANLRKAYAAIYGEPP